MKSYWMNEPVQKERIEKKKTTTDIIATSVQREAIFALERHVFGSKEAYFDFRESGKPFPGEYKAAKNYILNYPWGTMEYFENFIQSIPTLEESAGYSLTAKFATKKYMSETDRKRPIKNPKSFHTYKARVSSLQSRLRKKNMSESEIRAYVDTYTTEYNTQFNTNFESYYSRSYN